MRNLFKNRVSSFTNIGVLAVGMAVSILIGLWIYDELSFNKYLQNYAAIAQLMKNATYDGILNTDVANPIPLDPKLRSSYESNFKSVVRSSGNTMNIITFTTKNLHNQAALWNLMRRKWLP